MRCDCQEPARVAKVKRRIPKVPADVAASPLRPYLRHLAKWMLICLAAMLVAALALGVARAHPSKAIDCRALIAGWHPDVPAHIAMKCRKAAHA